MSANGTKDCASRPPALKPARPQSWPTVFEHIGRRADGEMARDRHLLVPGIEAVGLHADGDVEIEPDAHAELPRPAPWRHAIWLSAVHCTNSTNSTSRLSGPLRSSAHFVSSGCCHSSGHSHHGAAKRCRSTSKQAKRDNSGARAARKASNWLRRSPLALSRSCRRRRARPAISSAAMSGIGHTIAFAQPRGGRSRVGDEVGGNSGIASTSI